MKNMENANSKKENGIKNQSKLILQKKNTKALIWSGF